MSDSPLDATDPAPPDGSLIRDSLGRYWERDDRDDYGPHFWYPVTEDRAIRDGDPESWTKVAGNYGPVTVIEAAT